LPVLATVNDIHSDGISAKSGVSWYTMGKRIGDYLAKRHPVGGEPARVAWFPGPRTGGWVRFIDAGFRDGINAGAVDLVAVKWGDSGKRIQRNLIQEVLNDTPDIDYIIGSAPTAEAAVSELRIRQLTGSIQILSTYFTHGVFRGIKRGQILAAPTDSPVLQGRLSIDQAVRLLEQQPIIRHAGPRIIMVDQQSAARFDASESLAPAIFSPTFTVD
jgi:protein TorT